MKTYKVVYRMGFRQGPFDTVDGEVMVKAKDMFDAEYKAIEEIEKIEGSKPYRAWTDSYITKNGRVHQFYYDVTN